MIRPLTICAVLAVAGSAHAQNSIYDTVGLGFGGSAIISAGGSGPTADTATDPFAAKIDITVGGSSTNLQLYDLSVGVKMYYLPAMGNGSTSNGGGWQCVPALYDGPPHGPDGETDPWPVDTTVQMFHPPGQPAKNIFYLKFHTGGNFDTGGGFTIGHVLEVQLVCAPRNGQY